MTEYTDKASRKSGKATPKGRPGKSRSPKGKQAKAPGSQGAGSDSASASAVPPADDKTLAGKTAGTASGETKQPESTSLAPDPATISFGSNRPIVATPRKVPEGSGLHFAGPSAGELKASGPQPSSAKASGLTFTNAKPTGTKPAGATYTSGKPESKKPETAKAEAKSSATPNAQSNDKSNDKSGNKPNDKTSDKTGAPSEAKPGTTAGTTSAKGTESSKVPASGSKTPAGKTPAKSEGKSEAKPGAKNAPLTKPAIAPQQSGRRLEKERSSSSFVLTLLGLVVAVGGLAFWMNGGKETPAPREEIAAVEPAPEFSADTAPPMTPGAETPSADNPNAQPLGPSPRAPVTPGPLVGDTAPAPVALTAAQIGEIQKLLDGLGLGPGNLDGVITAETTAAIRAYQEMAGLPADGAANQALLDELRSVAELYGG